MGIEEVVRVLDETDYRIRVHREGDGIVLVVPPNLALDPESEGVVQHVRVHRGEVEGISCRRDGEEDASFIPMPAYAVRCVLSGLVGRACEVIGFPSSLVDYAFEDGSRCDGLFDLIDEPEDRVRERLLAGVLRDAEASGFTPDLDERATGLGVGRAFQICKTFHGESN